MRKRCDLEVERPLKGGPYHDLTFEVRCLVDGVQAGKALVWRQEEAGREVMAISNIVVEKYKRQGLGTQMYERAAQVACEDFGLPLASDKSTSRSKYAEGFWKKQQRKGRAICIGESGSKKCRRWMLSCPAPTSLAAPAEVEPILHAKERELAKLEHERGVIFEKDGRMVWEKKGTRARIKLTADDLKLLKDRIFTHNHPLHTFQYRGPNGEIVMFRAGGSLSPRDVETAVTHDAAEIRAVTQIPIEGKLRTVVYRLERPKGGWPRPSEIASTIKPWEKVMRARLQYSLRRGEVKYEDVATAVMHRVWGQTAKSLGMKYEAMVLSGAPLTPRRRRS